MNIWRNYKISDIGKVITGGTPLSKFPLHFGDYIPFITPSDFGDYLKTAYAAKRSISKEGANANQNKLLPENSILVTCIGSDMGKVVINKTVCLTNQQINSIIPDFNIIDYNFLYYSIIYKYEHLRLMASDGTTMPIVNKTDFENIEINLPPLATQTRIASILSSLDDKIELNRRMNQTLEQMSQALFNHYFVDNIDADNLPEEWKWGKVGDIGFIQNGFAFKSKDFLEKGQVGIIKIKNINNNIVDIHSTQYIPENVIINIDEKFKIESGDILIAMTGAEVGKIGIVPNNSKDLWLNQRVGNIKEKYGYGKNFLYVVLTSDNYQTELNSTAMGSAQPNISGTDIENIKMIIPEKKLIQKFDSLLSPLFEKICQNLEENNILSLVRDTLLPKLMSGEIDVDKIMDEEQLIENQLADCKTA